MKTLVKTLFEAVLKFAIATMDKEQINSLMKEVATEWVEKHLTADEIKNEINDLGKFLKEKF